MDVLQHERERVFAPVTVARLTDRARRRIAPEGLVVRAAVVVAGQSKQPGNRQDQQRRRKRQPRRPGRRPWTKPAVRGVAEAARGVKRGKIRPVSVVLALEGGPRRVHDEGRQSEKHDERLNPPGIPPGCLAESPPPDDYRDRGRSRHKSILLETRVPRRA